MADYPTAETDRRIGASPLSDITIAIFKASGMHQRDAALLADSLIHADLRGVHSHGVLRIPDYVHKLKDGGVNPAGKPSVVSRNGAAAVVDGGNNMGQIGASFAMEMAHETGVALVALRGSNALPTMAPLGGRDKIVGMNPVSIAIPGHNEPPVVLDMAFGATAHGKIRVYHQKDLPLPTGWAYDANGEPTTDAGIALEGLIQPAGGNRALLWR